MAFQYPEDLRYLDSHEYVRIDGNVATIGVTEFAIDQLGDIVFLDLPELGTVFSKGESFGSLESVKAVEDLYAPVNGTVIGRNEILLEDPEKIAQDPYGDSWLLKIQFQDLGDLEHTLSASEYQDQVEGS